MSQIYIVKGMHCSSCAQIIKGRLAKLSGIKEVSINYATEEAVLDYDSKQLSFTQINNEIKKLGYSLNEDRADTNLEQKDKLMRNSQLEHQKNKRDFIIAVPAAVIIFLIMLYELAAKYSPLPELKLNVDLLNLLMALASTLIIFIPGKRFLLALGRFFRYRVANMDTLIGLGAGTAYAYSIIILIFPALRSYLSLANEYYFDATIVVIGFVILGKYLESSAKQKSGSAIKALMSLQTNQAIKRLSDGSEEKIPISEVKISDYLIIKPGMQIPVDGSVTSGTSNIDESMISGEAMPIKKKLGSKLIAGTLNKQGSLIMIAEKIGSDTVLSKIIDLVHKAQNSKAPIQKIGDKIAAIFVPIVLIISLITISVWLIIAPQYMPWSLSLSLGISSFVGVLVIACPCALGLATPTALIAAIGRAAKNGILIKNAEALEKLKNITTIVFDKTGTITKGEISVSGIKSLRKSLTEFEILTLSAALEQYSEHPVAEAIIKEANLKNVNYHEYKVEDFLAVSGEGVEAKIDGKQFYLKKHQLSNNQWAQTRINLGETILDLIEKDKVIAHIACSDEIKPEAKNVINALHAKKLKTVMLTGDRKEAAIKIAKAINIQSLKYDVTPADKAEMIKQLQNKGEVVLMVGDGINDAPALAFANSSIAMGTGTDVALAAADITLMQGNLNHLIEVINLSKKTFQVVKQNLFWASIYNLVGIPLAAGLFYPLFDLTLNPVFAGVAMSASSVVVVMNSLRLRFQKIE